MVKNLHKIDVCQDGAYFYTVNDTYFALVDTITGEYCGPFNYPVKDFDMAGAIKARTEFTNWCTDHGYEPTFV